jgi:CRP-like cAMP-binding protein
MLKPSGASLVVKSASIGLFKGLGSQEIRVILASAARQFIDPGEIVIRAEDDVTSLFLVELGSIDYYVVTDDGREILLRRLVPGNVFGVAAFLSEPGGYLGTAKAVSSSELLVWDQRAVRHLARTYPQLGDNALRTALQYIRLYIKRHTALLSKSARERLACALTGMGAREGHMLPSGMEIDIKNEDLASLADISFFTASRFLKDWERKGVLEKSRGKVLIRRPEKLLAA